MSLEAQVYFVVLLLRDAKQYTALKHNPLSVTGFTAHCSLVGIGIGMGKMRDYFTVEREKVFC